MMDNVFFIGDLHFGHKNIIGYNRPQFNDIEEMNCALVENWNKVVRKRDKVFVLGDVAFGKDNLHYLAQCNGTKDLILGNHDTYTMEHYAFYFKKIYGCKYYKNNTIMTHIPIHVQQFGRFKLNVYGFEGFDLNVHGHIHHDAEEFKDDNRYFNVCADHVNLTPVAWEDIKKKAFG